MKSLKVHFDKSDAVSYEICWAGGFSGLAEKIRLIPLSPKKICIVSDSNTAALYLDALRDELLKQFPAVESFVFEAGEKQKTLETICGIYSFLLAKRFERKDIIVALGGGVTGDMAGFAASTYRRGIDFIQVPTTLLSQVDSSIGGKTGVDFEHFKNMIGAFHQPRLVYMNMSALETLPDDQFASGMGEILKTALIRDASLLDRLDEEKDPILQRDPEILTDIICRCCEIKAAVVEQDPLDTGIRSILNFGHTIGHAVEKSMDFSLLHGQCVALGMLCASRISVKRGMLTDSEFDTIRKLLRFFGLPESVSGISAETILTASRSDKKMEYGRLKFVLLAGIGNTVIVNDVTDEEILDACRVIL